MSPRRANSPERPSRRQPPREPWALAKRTSLDLDSQRYLLHTQGLSAAEIAARENVRLATVEKSIEKLRLERLRYSQESLEHTVRQSAVTRQPSIDVAISRLLSATKLIAQEIFDEESGELRREFVEVPDYALHVKAIELHLKGIEAIRQQVPMVSISNQNLQQTNFTQGGISTESLIRQIREERGLALPADIVKQDDGPLMDTIDIEMQQDIAEGIDVEEENDEKAEKAEDERRHE